MQDHKHVIGEYLLNSKDRVKKLLGIINPEQFGPELPVDFLGQNDLQSHGIATVFNSAVKTLVYWSYMIGEKDADPAGVIDVGGAPGSYKVVSVARNAEQATRLYLAAMELQDHAAANNLPTDIRKLSIPGCGVEAVWNRAGDGFFIPVLSIPKMPLKVMDRDTFYNFLKNPPASGNTCPVPPKP